MIWTEKEVNILKKEYPKRISTEDIAKKIGKTRRAIQHKAARLEIFRPHYKFNVKEKQPRKIIEKRYYEKNKDKIYKKKQKRLLDRRNEFKKLLGGKCSKCGYDKSFYGLDFHHIKGKEKEGHVSRIIKDCSKQKALKEINKCILLCANCHRELHHGGA